MRNINWFQDKNTKLILNTVKQKALFSYINDHRMKIDIQYKTVTEIYNNIKKPFDSTEKEIMLGEVANRDLIEYFLWTNIADTTVKLDNDLLTSCMSFLSWIKELALFQYMLSQERTIDILLKNGLSDKIKPHTQFSTMLKKETQARLVIEKYDSFLESICFQFLHLYCYHYIVDSVLDEKIDLHVLTSKTLIFEAYRYMYVLCNFVKIDNNEIRSPLDFCKSNLNSSPHLLSELLYICFSILAKHQIFIPIFEIDHAISYATKKVIDHLSEEMKYEFDLDSPHKSDTISTRENCRLVI